MVFVGIIKVTFDKMLQLYKYAWWGSWAITKISSAQEMARQKIEKIPDKKAGKFLEGNEKERFLAQ